MFREELWRLDHDVTYRMNFSIKVLYREEKDD